LLLARRAFDLFAYEFRFKFKRGGAVITETFHLYSIGTNSACWAEPIRSSNDFDRRLGRTVRNGIGRSARSHGELSLSFGEQVYLGMVTMKKREAKLSEADSLLRRGLDPDIVEGLQRSQEAYKGMGVDWTLEEVFAFEVEDQTLLDDEEPEE
jgi:hypothetical protein